MLFRGIEFDPTRRELIRRVGTTIAIAPLAMSALPALLEPKPAQAAGFELMWNREIDTYYPGSSVVARQLGFRKITAADSGLASLDRISTVVAREKYGIEVVFDNLGWYQAFENQYLSELEEKLNREELSLEEYVVQRRAFGFCQARAAWATRDSWPFRVPGENLFDIPGLVAPGLREMVEMQLIGFAPLAFYLHSADEAANLAFFRDRALNNPGDVNTAFMVDIPNRGPNGQAFSGEWWGHVADIQHKQDGYWYLVSKAGAKYKLYHESAIRFAVEPVDYSDLENPPADDRPNLMLRLPNKYRERYRSPYFFAPFVRAIYYGEPLPSEEKLVNFLDSLDSKGIEYRPAA